MKRFFKTFALLIISLFLLVSGVDATLDHMAHSTSENTYTFYSNGGAPVLAYSGNLAFCPSYMKPEIMMAHHFLHRIKANS